MAKIIEKSPQKLILKAYPKCIVGLCLGFLALLGLASVLQNLNAEFKDYAIFIGVALVIISIQKHRLTTFDKSTGYGEIIATTILGQKTFKFKLADVQEVMMFYGRGQYARGGTIGLEVNYQQQIISNSDICFGNRERNIRLTEEIVQWL